VPTEYRAGPVYRGGLIVSGGMCAGLAIAILVAMVLHRQSTPGCCRPAFPLPPASATGFVACGLASIGGGPRAPRVTSKLAMVTLSMAVTLAAGRAFGLEPRVETLVAANLGAADWYAIAPNTAVVLLLAAAALLMRHTHRWFDRRLVAIAIPRWFSLVVCTGAVVITVSTAVEFLHRDGQTWAGPARRRSRKQLIPTTAPSPRRVRVLWHGFRCAFGTT